LKTILIVESDLGLVAFLSKSLSDAGYEVIPAPTSQTATMLLEELENPKVDLLVANLALPGAADLIPALKKKNQSLKVIAVEDASLSAISDIPVDARLQKPSPSESAAENQWLGMVKQVLDNEAA